MRASARGVLALPLLAAALASLAPGCAVAEAAAKPRIIDGETLAVAGQRFRLAGIAAPALDQTCERAGQAYPCGKVARAVLWDLVGGREVSCQPLAGAPSPGTGTIAATCKAGEVNLNEAMVAAGWALADRATVEAYGALEDEAKKERRGLWTGSFEPPGAAPPSASADQPAE